MRNLFIISIAALLLVSCKEERIPLPDGLLVEETIIDMVAEGETYRNRVYTTASHLEVTVPEAARSWLSAEMEEGYLVITSIRNESIGPRVAAIGLTADKRSSTVTVSQTGLPTIDIPIVSAVASSQAQNSGNESIESTWNPERDVFWHTAYSANSSPRHWAIWTLEEGTPSIDLVKVTPRYYDPPRIPNGRFTHYGIWVKGEGTDTPSIDPDDTDDFGEFSDEDPTGGWGGLIGKVDTDGFKLVYKGNAELGMDVQNCVIVPVDNPTEVKMVFPGLENTQGGHVTVRFIKFERRVSR